MKKPILFSVLVFSAALILVGCKSGQNEPEGGGSTSGKSKGHNYVDLGLSVKWATCNVGASTPEEYGDYFAWGETATKETYSWSNYFDTNDNCETFTKYNNDGGKTVLDPEDDAAHVHWGGSWRMPTKTECQELKECCTWVWTTQKGINGYKVTSKKAGYTDRSIFLPAAGYRFGGLIYAGSCGYNWSSSLKFGSSLACCLRFGSDNHDLNGYYSYGRWFGLSVRPVLP